MVLEECAKLGNLPVLNDGAAIRNILEQTQHQMQQMQEQLQQMQTQFGNRFDRFEVRLDRFEVRMSALYVLLPLKPVITYSICAKLPSLDARNRNSTARTQNSVASILDRACGEVDALVDARTALPVPNFPLTVSDLVGMSGVHTNEVLLALGLSRILLEG